MPLVATVKLNEMIVQKSPSMSGSDKLFQDRLQRETTVSINQIVAAIKEIQDYLA